MRGLATKLGGILSQEDGAGCRHPGLVRFMGRATERGPVPHVQGTDPEGDKHQLLTLWELGPTALLTKPGVVIVSALSCR
jgi:hypothetical protein